MLLLLSILLLVYYYYYHSLLLLIFYYYYYMMPSHHTFISILLLHQCLMKRWGMICSKSPLDQRGEDQFELHWQALLAAVRGLT